MGWGDELMGAGIATEAASRGKIAAFGDGRQVKWSAEAYQIFQDNPDVVIPGRERYHDNVEWFRHHKGKRLYGDCHQGVWTWDRTWHLKRGRVFLTPSEEAAADRMFPTGAVVIEPNSKMLSPNKRWATTRYAEVAKALQKQGHRVVQFDYGHSILRSVEPIQSPSFRTSLAMMAKASFYVGPEGGLHHGAAAVNTPAVVIFGGYIHPRTTGYDDHVNLFGADEPCGRMTMECDHCKAAMEAITVDQVVEATAAIRLKKAA